MRRQDDIGVFGFVWVLVFCGLALLSVFVGCGRPETPPPMEDPVGTSVKVVKVYEGHGSWLHKDPYKTLVELPDGSRRTLTGDLGEPGERINVRLTP